MGFVYTLFLGICPQKFSFYNYEFSEICAFAVVITGVVIVISLKAIASNANSLNTIRRISLIESHYSKVFTLKWD